MKPGKSRRAFSNSQPNPHRGSLQSLDRRLELDWLNRLMVKLGDEVGRVDRILPDSEDISFSGIGGVMRFVFYGTETTERIRASTKFSSSPRFTPTNISTNSTGSKFAAACCLTSLRLLGPS